MTRRERDVQAGHDASLYVHFPEAEQAVAEADAASVAALGLPVVLAPLHRPVPDGRQMPVALLYLSAGTVEHHREAWRARFEQTRREHATAVVIALDDTPPPLRLKSAPLQRHALSRIEYLRLLLAGVLEALDRTGWLDHTLVDDRTRIVPNALVVSGAGSHAIIPPDFRGLVTVGRSPSCQISVASTFASRLHGCFRSSADHFLYRDMSTNGTILYDGHEELLLHDDEHRLPRVGELRIGDVSLTFSTQQP